MQTLPIGVTVKRPADRCQHSSCDEHPPSLPLPPPPFPRPHPFLPSPPVMPSISTRALLSSRLLGRLFVCRLRAALKGFRVIWAGHVHIRSQIGTPPPPLALASVDAFVILRITTFTTGLGRSMMALTPGHNPRKL